MRIGVKLKMKNKEIEFETLHSNKKRIYFLCGFVCVVVLFVLFIIGRSHAKYRVTQSIPLVNGTINYTPYDLKLVAMFQENDLYTVDGSSKGNHALDYPIGLITADEVTYAGGVYGSNNRGYYLYTNKYCWTMSLYLFRGSDALVFFVPFPGNIDYYTVNYLYAVRPVINLRSDVAISSGDGTSSSPFIVS